MSVLEFDWPEIAVGTAAYPAGPTGCTVIRFPRCQPLRGRHPRRRAGGDRPLPEGRRDLPRRRLRLRPGGRDRRLGGDPGRTRTPHRLDRHRAGQRRHRLRFRHARQRGLPGPRPRPRRLRRPRAGRFEIGRVGGGSASSAGKGFRPRLQGEFSGQGAAFRQIGAVKIAFFTVLNPLGALIDRAGRVRLGNRGADGRRRSPAEALAEESAPAPSGGNTTISVLAINQRLEPLFLQQLGRQVHASMARGIQPFHGMNDGDVLFTVTTDAVDVAEMTPFLTATHACEVAWDAILSVVPAPD